MSAKWRLGTINVFVSDQDIGREIKRAELFILDSTDSTWHFFGAGSEKRTIKGLVIGDTDRNAIIALAIGDTAFTFVTPFGNTSNAKINSTPKFTNKLYAGATLDGVVYDGSITPIYDAEIEIIQT